MSLILVLLGNCVMFCDYTEIIKMEQKVSLFRKQKDYVGCFLRIGKLFFWDKREFLKGWTSKFQMKKPENSLSVYKKRKNLEIVPKHYIKLIFIPWNWAENAFDWRTSIRSVSWGHPHLNRREKVNKSLETTRFFWTDAVRSRNWQFFRRLFANNFPTNSFQRKNPALISSIRVPILHKVNNATFHYNVQSNYPTLHKKEPVLAHNN